MRIKLKPEQLSKLSQQLTVEVVLEEARDVRGMLELLGQKMPWDETGMSKFGDSVKRPLRVTFSVEGSKEGYVCDIHPALAHYIDTLLSS